MPNAITIVRYPYEEPYHVNLLLDATNGRLRGQLEFYANTDVLSQSAEVLMGFPRHVSDVHLLELGSERSEDRFASYLRLRLFLTDRAGHCALQVRMNNNCELPAREISEFCIEAESTDLNRLGSLLHDFKKLEHAVLQWAPPHGSLHRTIEEARLAGVLLRG